MNIDILRSKERDAILDFLTYNMDQDLRAKLMNEFPNQYNRMIGRDIMKVVRAS